MCIFRRLYYNNCSHYQYLGPDPVRKCHLQQAYECGETEIPCGKMLPHSYMSLKVDEPCNACAAKISKADRTLLRIKAQLAMAKLKLRIPADVVGKSGQEGADDGDEALSPVDLNLSFAGIGKGSRRGLAVAARQ